VSDLVVIGLGYVGLPAAREAVRAGLDVVGFDVSESVVAELNDGRSRIDDVSADDVKAMLDAGFVATSDPACLADADACIICVPTPLSMDDQPDLDMVLAAVRAVADHLHPGMLVVLESTTYPGTTDEVVPPSSRRAG
jgi:UDP-N-acetyl-D-glucosamine dehydrogenase